MCIYFKKLFSVLLAAVVLVTAVVPSDAGAAVRPARPVFKVVKRGKRFVNIKINRTKNATGYQIFIASSRRGRFKQVAASRIRTVKITKLKKNRAYYIKVRAFKTVGYHITYGRFSKIVKVSKYSKKKPVPSIIPDVPTGPSIIEAEDPSVTVEPSVTTEPEQTPWQTQEPEPGQMPWQTQEPETGQIPDAGY